MEKKRILHCRFTEAEHQAIKDKAEAAGLSITQLVVRAALSAPAEPKAA